MRFNDTPHEGVEQGLRPLKPGRYGRGLLFGKLWQFKRTERFYRAAFTTMSAKPLLSDIQSRKKFNPGDRVIVRVVDDLTDYQRARIAKAINKYARCDVRTIVVNCMRMRIVLSSGSQTKCIAGREYAYVGPNTGQPGVASMSTGVVDMRSGDRLDVIIQHALSSAQKRQVGYVFKEWAGDDVEVVVTDNVLMIGDPTAPKPQGIIRA